MQTGNREEIERPITRVIFNNAYFRRINPVGLEIRGSPGILENHLPLIRSKPLAAQEACTSHAMLLLHNKYYILHWTGFLWV
jgi:hypothetical protein